MEQRYENSELQATEIIETLSSDDVKILQENKFKDIHCLVSSLSKAVTSAVSDINQHLRVIGEDGVLTGERPVLQSVTELQSVAREITHLCFRSSERSQNKCLIPTDRPLLTALYTVGATEMISENDSKAIAPFDNAGVDSELKCEIFLQDVVNLS